MRLTDKECEAHRAAGALPTDVLRQGAYSLLDDKIRSRLKIPERLYYSPNFNTGAVVLDMKRTRVPPVKKLSKSDL